MIMTIIIIIVIIIIVPESRWIFKQKYYKLCIENTNRTKLVLLIAKFILLVLKKYPIISSNFLQYFYLLPCRNIHLLHIFSAFKMFGLSQCVAL
jgi:hypothetical protein